MKIIASVPVGGGVDTVTRMVAEELQKKFGQPLMVDNRGGEPIKTHFAPLLLQPEASSRTETAAFLARETQRWVDVIKKAGVQPH